MSTANIQSMLDNLGLDLDVQDIQGLDITGDTQQLQHENKDEVKREIIEVKLIQPYNPAEGQWSDITKTQMLENGSQIKINLLRRPQCPNCEYVVAAADEPMLLKGHCSECQTQTCPRCHRTCSSCGVILCDTHATGHGLEEQPYCSSCITDIREQHEHERELEEEEQEWEQHKEEQHLYMTEEEQRRDYEIKDRQKRIDEWNLLLQIAEKVNKIKSPEELREEQSGRFDDIPSHFKGLVDKQKKWAEKHQQFGGNN